MTIQFNADSYPDLAWGIQRAGIQTCWEQGFTGSGVRVGHLDTGVDSTHPALCRRIAEFVEFDKDGYPVPESKPRDPGSHGTHTAGIICGGLCDGMFIGVAPGAELCSGMVIEGGKCLLRVLAGLDWILDCGVRVLCLSLGVPVYNPVFEIILSRMKRAGILVVAPVGNKGSGSTCFPAGYPGVLAVGATGVGNQVARFSGSYTFARDIDPVKPDLVAPGVNIPSAGPGGGIQVNSGTSMAAAHVVGAAAVLFQARPEATAVEVEQALLNTCTPLPDSSGRRCGRGLVNAAKALEILLSSKRSHSGWESISTSA